MTKAEARERPAEAIAKILGAAVFAVVVGTGVLTLVFVVVAAMRHNSVSELMDEVLPRFRGGTCPADVPALGYVVFVIYIVATSGVAIAIRRRLARR